MTLTLPMKLPTSVVGSHGLPGWVWLAREAMAQGRLGAIDVRELMEDATQIALLDQERAGVDVVTTGEMMRVRFIIGFYEAIHGITTLPAPLKLGGGYRDKDTLLADLVKIVNAECKALVAVGADFIQIDEPHHGMYHGSAHDVGKGVNRAIEGVDAKIAVHVCFGNLYGRPFSAVRDYANVFATLHEIEASQIVLEFANRGLDDAARWKEFPRDKELGAGVVDVKAFKSETPQDVAQRIRALLRHVAPDKLWLNPDCGFWETPRWVVKLKLHALVEGARLVRKELG